MPLNGTVRHHASSRRWGHGSKPAIVDLNSRLNSHAAMLVGRSSEDPSKARGNLTSSMRTLQQRGGTSLEARLGGGQRKTTGGPADPKMYIGWALRRPPMPESSPPSPPCSITRPGSAPISLGLSVGNTQAGTQREGHGLQSYSYPALMGNTRPRSATIGRARPGSAPVHSSVHSASGGSRPSSAASLREWGVASAGAIGGGSRPSSTASVQEWGDSQCGGECEWPARAVGDAGDDSVVWSASWQSSTWQGPPTPASVDEHDVMVRDFVRRTPSPVAPSQPCAALEAAFSYDDDACGPRLLTAIDDLAGGQAAATTPSPPPSSAMPPRRPASALARRPELAGGWT